MPILISRGLRKQLYKFKDPNQRKGNAALITSSHCIQRVMAYEVREAKEKLHAAADKVREAESEKPRAEATAKKEAKSLKDTVKYLETLNDHEFF